MLFGLLAAHPPWTRHETHYTLPKFGNESEYGITHARNPWGALFMSFQPLT